MQHSKEFRQQVMEKHGSPGGYVVSKEWSDIYLQKLWKRDEFGEILKSSKNPAAAICYAAYAVAKSVKAMAGTETELCDREVIKDMKQYRRMWE